MYNMVDVLTIVTDTPVKNTIQYMRDLTLIIKGPPVKVHFPPTLRCFSAGARERNAQMSERERRFPRV